MAQFKSYASPQGFNPIKVPDETGKYRQQGQNYMRAMQRAMDFDIQNRNRYATAMQNAQRIEAGNRELIFKLDQQNRERVQNQIQGNYQQTIRDAERQGAQELKTLESLASFSNTAFEAVNTFYQKREEGIKLGVHQAIYATGVDLKGLQEIYKLDKNLTDQSLNENQFIKGLLDSGASIQDIRYLMKHSNAKYWNESIALAQNIGAGFSTYSTENWDTKYKYGEEELSLSEAMSTNRPEVVEFILGNQRSTYFSESESGALNINPKVAAVHIHPAIKAYENQVMTAANAASRKFIDGQVEENLVRGMQQTLDRGGIEAALLNIQEAPAGAQRAARKALLYKVLGSMSMDPNRWENGQEMLQRLMGLPMTLDDGTETTFGEFNKNDPKLLELMQSFKEARRGALQDYNLTQAEEKARYHAAEVDLAQMLRDNPGGFSNEDIQGARLRLRELFPELPGEATTILDALEKNESTNALYEQSITETLDKLQDSGQLTEERLNQMGVPGRIADKYRAAARRVSADRAANNDFKPQLESLTILAQSPPQVAAKVIGGKPHRTVPLMEQKLHNEFYRKYQELSAAGDPNAAEAARSFVENKFLAQIKNPKFFDSEGGYVEFSRMIPPSTASTARMNWVQGRITDLGVKALDSNGAIFTISELNAIEQNASKPNFKMDPMAVYIGRQTGVDPFTVINRQRVAAGLPIMQLPESTMRFNAQASPELKRKLSAYRTPEISTRAMISTRQFDETRIPNGYAPMVVAAAKKYGVAPNYIAALIEIESSWDPNAGSKVGAIGLMQIHPPDHPQYKGGNDPQANIDYGTSYYTQLLKKYGDPVKAVGAYNAGPGRFDEYLTQGRPLPEETIKHMAKFSIALAKYGDVSQLRSTTTMRNTFAVRQYVSGDPAIQGMNTGSVIYDPVGHGGQAYHNHYEFATKQQAMEAKKLYESKGYRVTSYIRPGDPGAHGKGYAIDVAPPTNLPYDREAEAEWSAKANAVIGFNPLQ